MLFSTYLLLPFLKLLLAFWWPVGVLYFLAFCLLVMYKFSRDAHTPVNCKYGLSDPSMLNPLLADKMLHNAQQLSWHDLKNVICNYRVINKIFRSYQSIIIFSLESKLQTSFHRFFKYLQYITYRSLENTAKSHSYQ